MIRPFLLTTCLISLASCTPSMEKLTAMAIPSQWKQQPTASTGPALPDTTAPWWENFQDAELNSLVTDALAHNNDVQAAITRVEQARASRVIGGAGLWPNLNLTGGASKNNSDINGTSERYNAQLGVAYELDLFGKNLSLKHAADANFRASQYDKKAIDLITSSDVTASYFNTLSLDDQIKDAEQNVSNAQEILDIIEARFKEGSVSALEVSQQRTELATTQAQRAALIDQRNASLTQLAVLLGKAPQEFNLRTETLAELTAPQIAPTLPATLLTARPDIQRAEATLAAARANVSATRAALFPSLTLGASASALANPAEAVTSISASLVAPLFQGGRLKADLDRVTARQMELVQDYQKTVLTAFKEVEDALSANKAADTRYTLFTTAATEADNAYNLARERFDAGAIDFQTLLDTQRSQLQAHTNLTQAKQESLVAALALYRALGGNTKMTTLALSDNGLQEE